MSELQEIEDLARAALPGVIERSGYSVADLRDSGRAENIAKATWTIAQAMFNEKRKWNFDSRKSDFTRT